MLRWREVVLACAMALLAAAEVWGAEFTWFEGETPDSVSKDVNHEVTDWDRGVIMSGGKLLRLHVPVSDIPTVIGDEGVIFTYKFSLKSGGKHQVWARIGYEYVRSDFLWRIDGGEWQRCKNSDWTVDLYSVVTWRELAWIHLADRDLTAGEHTLEVRHIPGTRKSRPDEEAKPYRILHSCDCFCIYKGEFKPNGIHKPGEDHQSDQDREAAAKVYEVGVGTAAGPADRIECELNGLWQVARWDEYDVDMKTRLDPTEALPADIEDLFWYSVAVPGDATSKDEFELCHRMIYRTKVKVPAELKGRGFFLDFQNFGMIATVFVNGKQAGWSKAHTTGWQCDITPQLIPGQVNEFAIVFKSVHYTFTDNVRLHYNEPQDGMRSYSGAGHGDMVIQSDVGCGILAPLSLIVTGSVYTSDVFAKPSVKRKELGLEITLFNPGAGVAKVKVENEIIPWNKGQGGPAEKVFAAREIDVPAGGGAMIDITEGWADPKLWWPDDPQLYWVVTRLSQNGRPLDVRWTRFGFREWDWSTHLFRLNGVNWQLWADCNYGSSPQEFVDMCKVSGMNNYRLWMSGGRRTWGGMYRREILDFMDEQGMPVRSSGVFDGQGIFYALFLRDPQTEDRVPNMPLFDNWRHQMRAWIKEERNHPSIYIWSIENEIAFINSWNLGLWSIVEPELRKGAAMVEGLDPTRPTMVDGGRALMDQSMPVSGCHYNDLAGISRRDLPDGHYNAREVWYRTMNRGRGWPLPKDRPMHHGECFFANGWRPSQFSALGGDKCFVGLSETMGPRSLYAKMMSEGYRWGEVSAWHMWFGSADRGYYNSWQPVCVFCRQWNWTFGAGETVTRTLAVFNSTHYAGPIVMGWELNAGNKYRVASGKKSYNVPPGEKQVVEISFQTPRVTERTECEFMLTCERNGREVFREVKEVSIIDPDGTPMAQVGAGDLLVIDSHGSAVARLRKRGVAFTELKSLDEAPQDAKMLIVGKNAVTRAESTGFKWRALATRGCRILVLEQEHPLHFQAVPADFELTDYVGRIAFCEDFNHPAFAGLAQKDFFCWNNDHVVYKNVYRKASKGARSLVQCDEELGFSAVAQCQVGEGLMLLCQLVVGEKLDSNAVAARVFDGMVNTIATYKPVRKETVVVMDPSTPAAKMLDSVSLSAVQAADPLDALAMNKGITIIDANPANLKKMAASVEKVRAYCENGGWIMLMGLTPEGLADYNRIVGFNHVIRPFQMERVVFSSPRDPLTSGLTLRDMVLDTGKKVNRWMSLMYPAEDEFRYIIDYDEIGTFARLPTAQKMGKPDDIAHPGWDHWPPNMVNNFTADDSWKWCYMITLDRGDLTKWTMELPKEEEIVNFGIVINVIYHQISKINFYFDDDPEPFAINLRPTHDRQDFAIKGKKARRITLEIADWQKSGRANVLGIDNLWVGVKRSPEFYRDVKCLLNIGGMMRYNIGRGGIVLNQLNILDNEVNPVNKEKKANVCRAILQNLGAVFGGRRSVVVGTGLTYNPVNLQPSQKFNAYLTRTGNPRWFGGEQGLDHLPAGESRFSGVKYRIADFRTSAVPGCIMLGGPGSHVDVDAVRDIPVGRKADALFFLHAYCGARQALEWHENQRRRRRRDPLPELFRYVVRYEDGKTADVVVRWDMGVHHWLQKDPKPVLDAALAWAAAFPNDDSGSQACLYSLQWDNPRPDVAIKSIDLVYAADGKKYGTPALIALTAADVVRPR